MIPRDRDSAAPFPEPDDAAADWLTEESVADPTPSAGDAPIAPIPSTAAAREEPTRLGDAHAGVGDGPPARPIGARPTLPPSTMAAGATAGAGTNAAVPTPAAAVPDPWTPAVPRAASSPALVAGAWDPPGGPRTNTTARPAPDPDASAAAGPAAGSVPDGVWLASAHGLVPADPEAAAAAMPPSSRPPVDFDLETTRVHPRPQAPANDWGWQPAEPGRFEAAGVPPVHEIPSVAPRSAAPYGWLPFDPEAENVEPAQPAPAARPVAAAVPGRAPEFDPNDPYGRQAIVGRAAVPGRDPLVDQRFEPAFADPDAVRRRRGVAWRRLFVSFVLGLLLAGVVAGGAIYAYEQQYTDRILPNVHVGSVDVSGLTRDAAHDRLAEAYAGYGQGTVQVELAGKITEIPYADIGRHADIDAMVDAAFGVGRAETPFDRLFGILRAVQKGATVQPAVVVDADALQARIHDIAQAAEWTAIDAGAVVTADGFATTPSKAGQSVDEGTAAVDAAAQLASIDAPDTIQVSLTATPIAPNVSDASAQLATKQAALMQNDVVLADGAEQWVIPASTVHGWLGFTIINNRVRIAIDTKGVLNQLKPLNEKIDRAAANATIKLQGTKIVFDKPSVDGRTFNPSKTTTAVVNALRNRALGTLAVDAPIPPVLALVKPALTTDEAKAAIPKMKAISTWTTNYQPSDHNGFGANIRIPTTTINGYVVGPHETFSFWKAVGPVTKELGYQDGGAIIDGHTEPQGAIGGGICSCSTTLFNAALRAGFQMGDRLNHFYYIDRYPLGLDATVFISASGQAQDMTWTNDTDYPVVIDGINGKTFVKFVLYSVPNGRTTTFTDPIVKNYTKAHTETRVDKSIPRGTSKHIEYATDGQDVWVTRQVKDAKGAVLHKETYYSHYATITGIILTNP